ncbi:hypothetical protein BN7_1217 [Wickerhamomyces ciferrii]|uniref:NAD(P)-binding domain-containing protein n=1 Tax=Wickerhamomyces ciferrii (strain ATCC 14091 / BCRC 22168 / CBS 111 / JCM 3599 / NBRC 0793 / NRRL Y-1031 F-60-10) TaxID=1206466 RepID=K0KFG0_WICCF|nr:uncharacterized protein BN7_1217 [Wickerhamomyces ciferrii]CCH41676.1 hypothetical protein BN7_1217 [Wickerhamomyces ciferrii]
MNHIDEPLTEYEEPSHTLLVLGGTGLVGSEFLKSATESANVHKVYVLTRRELVIEYDTDKIIPIVETDTAKWAQIISEIPLIDIVFSSLGTTKSAARGLKEQHAIDHDLNLELAKAAKLNHVKTFIIITSMNNSALSTFFPYFRIKKQLEDDLKKLGFGQLFILRPGPLAGDRSVLQSSGHSLATRLSGFIANTFHEAYLANLVGEPITAAQLAQVAMYYLNTTTSPSNSEVNTIDSGDMIWMAHAIDEADY